MELKYNKINVGWDVFITKIIGGVLITLVVAFLLAALMAFPVKWLWNYTMPFISTGSLPEIGFWRALTLNWLCAILLKTSASSSSK